MNNLKPTFFEEYSLWAQGCDLIAGVDEVGRGALAGPVVAAAVILPHKLKGAWLKQVRDSKLLTPARREVLSECIREAVVSFGVGVVPCEIINSDGIARATRLAMKRAIDQLSRKPEWLLIDFFKLPEVRLPQTGVIDGDSLCFSIACASIIAKVARDRLMVELDDCYPGYSFAEHKGYGTPEHLACLQRLGPSPIHRLYFQPVAETIQRTQPTQSTLQTQ